MESPSFTARFHWWVGDRPTFEETQQKLFSTLKLQRGIYSGDALIAWGRNLGFLEDQPLMNAWRKHALGAMEQGILWRTVTVVWAARQAARREGAFIECGCYAGTTAAIVMDACQLGDRPFYLYDLFEHTAAMAHHSMPKHGPELFEEVKARFADRPNVQVIRGAVPDSFSQGLPDRIAFAHIDMNNAEAEIGALDAIADRLVPGAVLVFDDFGQLPYRKQHVAEREWFARRGVPILEIPTGQGVVIW